MAVTHPDAATAEDVGHEDAYGPEISADLSVAFDNGNLFSLYN